METIKESAIEHAMLVSALHGKPAHIDGEWYAWGKTVLTKRLLLLVLIRGFSFSNIGHASLRVLSDYAKIQRCLPERYRLSINIADKLSCTATVADIWKKINSEVQVTKPVNLYGGGTFLAELETNITTEQIQNFILEFWGEEYDNVVCG